LTAFSPPIGVILLYPSLPLKEQRHRNHFSLQGDIQEFHDTTRAINRYDITKAKLGFGLFPTCIEAPQKTVRGR
jgi:hypothetical protein